MNLRLNRFVVDFAGASGLVQQFLGQASIRHPYAVPGFGKRSVELRSLRIRCVGGDVVASRDISSAKGQERGRVIGIKVLRALQKRQRGAWFTQVKLRQSRKEVRTGQVWGLTECGPELLERFTVSSGQVQHDAIVTVYLWAIGTAGDQLTIQLCCFRVISRRLRGTNFI